MSFSLFVVVLALQQLVTNKPDENMTATAFDLRLAALHKAHAGALAVQSAIGLLCDLYGEIGAARMDGDATRLARTLDLIKAEADRVVRHIEGGIG